MIIARANGHLVRATPRSHGSCPACGESVIAKCGPIVTWHWAHKAADCDSWSEPESEWHIRWKSYADSIEVVMRRGGSTHRADIVRPNGMVVELQSAFLSAVDIKERESFYGQGLVWLYRAEPWFERIHFGRRGFWWKHGAQSMASHRRTVFWDMTDEIWKVAVSIVEREDGSRRVLGKVISEIDLEVFQKWLRGPI